MKQRIQSSYSGQWKDNAIATHMGALSVNTLASRSLPPATGGNWVVRPDGVRLADDDGSTPEIKPDEAMAEVSIIEAATVSLERDMEATLVTGLHQLEPGMVLRDQQLDTGIVGRLDLLASDKDGQYVVIELKVGKADDRARICLGLDLDPKYVDVIGQRWQTLSSNKAKLDDDGRTFEEVAAERKEPA